VAALRRRTPKPRPDSATSNPVSREMRNVRHDTRDFSLQMACNINMLSQHIQRAEKERLEQVCPRACVLAMGMGAADVCGECCAAREHGEAVRRVQLLMCAAWVHGSGP
jgi:hypothetical protein